MERKNGEMSFRRAAVIGGLAVALSGPAVSSLSARAEPLVTVEGQAFDVSADTVEVDVEQGTAELRGNVTARLGDLDVRCQSVVVRYDRSPRVSWARGVGGVTAHVKGIEATAATIELDAKSRTVTLSGTVRLTRGRGWITAERATVELATNKISLQEVKGSIPVEPQTR